MVLYLVFNRIHHRVDHAIERVFFHKWQVNEAALKQQYEHLVLVADPTTLGRVRPLLHKEAMQRPLMFNLEIDACKDSSIACV